MNAISHATEILETIYKYNNTDKLCVLLSFGKDSLVTLDLAIKSNLWREIVCVYMYLAPDLDHINKRKEILLDHYKNSKTKLTYVEVPHFEWYYLQKQGIFCNPNPRYKRVKIKDIEAQTREEFGAYWTLSGWKQCDSLDRMVTLNTYEMQGIVADHKRAYPLTKMSQKEIFAYLKNNKLPPPLSYGNKKMSGLGLNKFTFDFLTNTYPNDLKKIQKLFPYFYL